MTDVKIYDLNNDILQIQKSPGMLSFNDCITIVNEFKYSSNYAKKLNLLSPIVNMTMDTRTVCNEFKEWVELSKHKDNASVRIMHIAGLLLPGIYPSLFHPEAIIPSIDTIHTVCVINNQFVVDLHTRRIDILNSHPCERFIDYIKKWVYGTFEDECSLEDFVTYIQEPFIDVIKGIKKDRLLKLIEQDNSAIDSDYKSLDITVRQPLNPCKLEDLVYVNVFISDVGFPKIDMQTGLKLREYKLDLSLEDYIELIAKRFLKEKLDLMTLRLQFDTKLSIRYETSLPYIVQFKHR